MQVLLIDSELSLIPDSDEDRDTLNRFMATVDQGFARVSLDGERLDELVIQPWCDNDASHCAMCGRRN